jgi:predicted dehydrogenase
MALTAGVIGCGNISRFHFSGLEKAGATVAWVCDLSEEAAAPWAEKFGATFTQDYNEIVADEAVDVIVITTISRVHKAICLDAIAAGKAVICEKTLAENAEDAFEIVSAAEKAGTIFYTSYMKRFIPAVAQAKALMPKLGRIFSTSIRAFQGWGDLWSGNPAEGMAHTPKDGMSLVRKNYGGGILVCGGSHILDLVCFFLGRPTKVFASVYTPDDRDYDLQAAALFETENGICHFEATAHPLKKIGFLRDGWDERVEINGTNGRLEIYSASWDQVDHKASMLVHYDNETGQSTEYRYDTGSPFDNAVAFFLENIEKGEQGSQSRMTGYDVDELIATVTKSGEEGQALEIQYKG